MDVDGTALAGMVFSLLCLVVIGGIILMYPVTRRLGQLLEQRVEDRKAGRAEGGVDLAALGELRATLESLEGEVARLGERQRFLEGLLEKGASPKELARP